MYSQVIRKYNSALDSAKHGDEDMAIIQLKKVTSVLGSSVLTARGSALGRISESSCKYARVVVFVISILIILLSSFEELKGDGNASGSSLLEVYDKLFKAAELFMEEDMEKAARSLCKYARVVVFVISILIILLSSFKALLRLSFLSDIM